MQFGMNHDVPGDMARTNSTSKIAWRFYTRPVKYGKSYLPSRYSEPYVTTRYLEWWNYSTGACSLQFTMVDNETKNLVKDESRTSKDSMDIDKIITFGLELEGRISKLEKVFEYLKAKDRNG